MTLQKEFLERGLALIHERQSNDSTHLSFFLEDARRVVLANRYIADLAPCQIYSSAMVFAPQTSVVRKICGRIPAWISRCPITPATWSPELQKLEGHIDSVRAVVFSQDGSLLASASDDETVRLWNPSTGQEMQKLENVSGVTTINLTFDNRILLTNRGAIYINTGSIHATAIESLANKTCIIKDDWIQRNNRNLLWLPQEYRGEYSAFCGNTFAIGRHSGQVSFIQINLT